MYRKMYFCGWLHNSYPSRKSSNVILYFTMIFLNVKYVKIFIEAYFTVNIFLKQNRMLIRKIMLSVDKPQASDE